MCRAHKAPTPGWVAWGAWGQSLRWMSTRFSWPMPSGRSNPRASPRGGVHSEALTAAASTTLLGFGLEPLPFGLLPLQALCPGLMAQNLEVRSSEGFPRLPGPSPLFFRD